MNAAPPSRGIFCIYRNRNARIVEELLAGNNALDGSWDIRLWALDEVSTALATHTVGAGPGPKFELCNRLLQSGPPLDYSVFADDDVRFDRLSEFLVAMSELDLDLAQPAHARASNSTYRFCRRRPWLKGRLTNFIEIGPIFAVGPRYATKILPFPENIGMGWGLEFDWYEYHRDFGLRIGIVDALGMAHLGKLGADYDMSEEGKRLRIRLDAHQVGNVEEFQRTLKSFGRWPRTRVVSQ